MNNVGLYVNGAQVGITSELDCNRCSKQYPIIFNLGSSLVVQSGQTVTLTVKADTINSSYGNYTNGNLSVTLAGEANNAQGLTSNVLSEVPSTGIVSNTLTLGVGAITLVTNPAVSAHSILANTANQEIGSYILNDNSSEAAQLTNVTVGLTGSAGNTGNIPLTSLSNLRTSITTTPVNPSVTNSFSVNSVIPANGSQEIDVFADVGQIATLANTSVATLSGAVTTSYSAGSAATYATGTITVTADAITTTATVNGYSATATFASSTASATIATTLAGLINARTSSHLPYCNTSRKSC